MNFLNWTRCEGEVLSAQQRTTNGGKAYRVVKLRMPEDAWLEFTFWDSKLFDTIDLLQDGDKVAINADIRARKNGEYCNVSLVGNKIALLIQQPKIEQPEPQVGGDGLPF